MNLTLNLTSLRARKARLAKRAGTHGPAILGVASSVLAVAGLYSVSIGSAGRLGYALLCLATLGVILASWIQLDLRALTPGKQPQSLDDVLDPALLADLKKPVTVASLWSAATHQPEGVFLCNRLLVDAELFGRVLKDASDDDLAAVWQTAERLWGQTGGASMHAGIVGAAILTTVPVLQPILTAGKLDTNDVLEVLRWLERQRQYVHGPKASFGGIGRDWATGFTPLLDEFGTNISVAIQQSGGNLPYSPHANLVAPLASLLGQGSAVALVGAAGVGKSKVVYALAQYVLQGHDPALRHYHVVALNASNILSASSKQLERRILSLFGEAIAAGNCILYLEDAHLFFGSGMGAFDMGQLLLPIIRNHQLKLIASFGQGDWQTLQNQQPALASSFSVISVQEPDEHATMQVAEDAATGIEYQAKQLISYEAIREALRLSGQFMQEQAYPGKLIRLLEQSTTYAIDQKIVTAASVQSAIENIKGVRVAETTEPEAALLLNLEKHIHARMVGQSRAVEVVAAALRRGRAGVSSPNRPIGSFLFLGPTGVGKTELARSLAATYFGDESRMVRLDMSEYQRPEDVSRLLSSGGSTEHSLIFAIRQQPFSVVLFDEIEKAHPAVLDLFLQLLDEGKLTDSAGNPASFTSSIVIVTSNAGAADITARVQAGAPLAEFERPLIENLISKGQFKPEFINRFDEVVLFSPLSRDDLSQIAQGMIEGVNRTLEPKRIRVELTPAALASLVEQGYDPAFGARPMRRVIQKTVENAVSVKILEGKAAPGSTIALDVQDIT